MWLKINLALIGVFIVITWFGFIGPWCVSSKDDTLVFGWPLLTVVIAINVLAFAIRKVYKVVKARINTNNTQENPQ